MDPVEITKLVAQQWYSLSAEAKQPFLDAAKEDAARFKRELEAFKLENPDEDVRIRKRKGGKKGKAKLLEESPPEPDHKDGTSKPEKKISSKSTSIVKPPSDPVPPPPSVVAQKISRDLIMTDCDLPIFTETFLEHNRAIESELKGLRKSNMDMEQENSVLYMHIESIQNGVSKVETEVHSAKTQNQQLEVYLNRLKSQLSNDFGSLVLPTMRSGATQENVVDYMNNLSKDPKLSTMARDVLWRLDAHH